MFKNGILEMGQGGSSTFVQLYTTPVTSDELTTEQAAKLGQSIGPMLRFLNRLQRRMDQTGFIPDDPLYRLVANAADAVHASNVDLHYRSCEGGVGRKPK